MWDTLVGHSCGALLWDTLVGHSCRTLLWDTLIGHSCGTLLWDTHTGHSCGTLYLGQSCRTHASRLQDERFVRDFLQKSHVKSPKRAFLTRLPPKVTRQVSKTSVSYETCSKTHMSKSAKQAFRTRLPPKVKRKHPSEHTHHAALPSSFAIPAPPNKTRSHANPNVTTFTSTTTHNLTILCACHENRTSTPQNPHKVLRLPRNLTISSHVSFHKNLHHTTPHVWNDFDPF